MSRVLSGSSAVDGGNLKNMPFRGERIYSES